MPFTPRRLRGSAAGPFFALAVPASLESPVRTVRGAPARRGGDSLDPRLLSGSPLSLRRTRGIHSAPLRARYSPPSALGSAKGAQKILIQNTAPSGLGFGCAPHSARVRGSKKTNSSLPVTPHDSRTLVLRPQSPVLAVSVPCHLVLITCYCRYRSRLTHSLPQREGAPHSSSTPSFSSIRTRRISGSPIRALGSSPSNRSSNVTPRPSTLTLPVQS